MKIASLVTGDVIEWNDEGARQLIAAGIYAEAEKPAKKEPPKEKKPEKSDKPTKVEPLTTEDFPTPVKTVT